MEPEARNSAVGWHWKKSIRPHAHMLARTQTHTKKHPHMRMHAHKNAHVRIDTHTQTRAPAHAHVRTYTHRDTRGPESFPLLLHQCYCKAFQEVFLSECFLFTTVIFSTVGACNDSLISRLACLMASLSSSECSAQGQVFHCKCRNQGCSSVQGQFFHCKLRNQGCSFTRDK